MIYKHKMLDSFKNVKKIIYIAPLVLIYLTYQNITLMIKEITERGETNFLSVLGIIAAIVCLVLFLYLITYTDKIYEKEIVMIRLFKKTKRVYISDVLENGKYLNKNYKRIDRLDGRYNYELSFRDKDNKRYVLKNINNNLFEALDSVGFKTPEIPNK